MGLFYNAPEPTRGWISKRTVRVSDAGGRWRRRSDHSGGRGLKVNVVHRPNSITERRVPELIPVLGSQPAGGVSHKPGGRLPLLSTGPAVTLATLKRAATSFAAW